MSAVLIGLVAIGCGHDRVPVASDETPSRAYLAKRSKPGQQQFTVEMVLGSPEVHIFGPSGWPGLGVQFGWNPGGNPTIPVGGRDLTVVMMSAHKKRGDITAIMVFFEDDEGDYQTDKVRLSFPVTPEITGFTLPGLDDPVDVYPVGPGKRNPSIGKVAIGEAEYSPVP